MTRQKAEQEKEGGTPLQYLSFAWGTGGTVGTSTALNSTSKNIEAIAPVHVLSKERTQPRHNKTPRSHRFDGYSVRETRQTFFLLGQKLQLEYNISRRKYRNRLGRPAEDLLEDAEPQEPRTAQVPSFATIGRTNTIWRTEMTPDREEREKKIGRAQV